MNDGSVNDRWIAIVYNRGDKVGSHMFYGRMEEKVRGEATKWVNKLFGNDRDWSLHRIYEK